MGYCYFNGEVLDESKATIPIHNIGIQRGFGVFDLFRARSGKPVFLEDHLARFDGSQQFMGLNRLIAKDEIQEAIDVLQVKNGFRESTFKLILLGGGVETNTQLEPFFYITNTDMSLFRNPNTASVILHEYVREHPKIKTINYFTSYQLHKKKMLASAVDVIYFHTNIISEASRSNVFIVKDGIIKTPKRNILEGITRKQILKFAEEIAHIEVSDITLNEFQSADEIFISSTLKEVLPIVTIDGDKVRDGKIGPITAKIQNRFFDLLRQ